jgi:hypothetical protein
VKINDVFFQNSNLQGAINDSSGLWLFANFKSSCFIRALRAGFMLGFYEGIDYGINSIKGDPNKVTLRLEILTKEGLYTYIDQSFERKDFSHSINKIQMNISNNLNIAQINDNELNWVTEDKSKRLFVNLNLKIDLFHLYPSIVLPNNFANIAVSPKTEISGEVFIEGSSYKVNGFGALDQYWSKKIQSGSAKKYGYSQYEPIMWNEGIYSVLYYIQSSDKKVYLQDLLVSLKNRCLKRIEKVDIKYIGYEKSNGNFIPFNYIVSAKSDELEVEYEVKIIPHKRISTWGYPEELIKSWVPDMPLIFAKGVIKEKEDKNFKEIRIDGEGIQEFVLAYYNPFKDI